jgi:hypothetical protein
MLQYLWCNHCLKILLLSQHQTCDKIAESCYWSLTRSFESQTNTSPLIHQLLEGYQCSSRLIRSSNMLPVLFKRLIRSSNMLAVLFKIDQIKQHASSVLQEIHRTKQHASSALKRFIEPSNMLAVLFKRFIEPSNTLAVLLRDSSNQATC